MACTRPKERTKGFTVIGGLLRLFSIIDRAKLFAIETADVMVRNRTIFTGGCLLLFDLLLFMHAFCSFN